VASVGLSVGLEGEPEGLSPPALESTQIPFIYWHTVEEFTLFPFDERNEWGPLSSDLNTNVSFAPTQKSGNGLLAIAAAWKAARVAFVPGTALTGAASTPPFRTTMFQSAQ
jgi:hypothetical protein